jgi:alkylation response protein AidB-like acyl-CoA dehydrogenase
MTASTFPPVDFMITHEQAALASTLRSFFHSRAFEPAQLRTPDLDRVGMRVLGTELGVLGLDVPAAAGGPGGELSDAVLLGIEAGRGLSGLPLIATDVACLTLAVSTDELLNPVLSGDHVMSVAGLRMSDRCLTATRDANAFHLDGSCATVVGAADSDAVLAFADSEEGPVVLAVERGTRGHSVAGAQSLDLSREWTMHNFAGTPARVVLAPRATTVHQPAIVDRVRIAIAADQVGIAEAVMTISLEYAKIRYQFGRAIGSQQAVKHRLVDMSISVERARAAVEYAARITAPDLRTTATLTALACANRGATEVCRAAIQVLGGIGMTWQHPAHLYLRRATVNRAIFPDVHRQLAELLWEPCGD